MRKSDEICDLCLLLQLKFHNVLLFLLKFLNVLLFLDTILLSKFLLQYLEVLVYIFVAVYFQKPCVSYSDSIS